MKKIIAAMVGCVALLIGIGAVLPALAKVRDVGAMPAGFVGSYTLGIFLITVVGSAVISCALKKQQPV